LKDSTKAKPAVTASSISTPATNMHWQAIIFDDEHAGPCLLRPYLLGAATSRPCDGTSSKQQQQQQHALLHSRFAAECAAAAAVLAAHYRSFHIDAI
jgi:hypothetical protein